MKKIWFALILLALSGCQYDDSWIKEEIADHEERISKLEVLCEKFNNDIKSLSTITDALSENKYITDVLPVTEQGKEVGYLIKFSDDTNITIYNGKDGADGKDGYVPQIGVKKDTDDNWYWTIDGNWMIDSEGERISTTGRKDLVPKLKIQDFNWYISYDGGKNWNILGQCVGENGESFFQKVTHDDMNVYMTLIDGSVLTLPKASEFTLELEMSENIPCTPWQKITIPYSLKGAGDKAEVYTLCEGEWTADVIQTSATTGTIHITVPEKIEEGKVVVIATNQTKTIFKELSFTEGTFSSKSSIILSDNGGEFVVDISTNYNYDVSVNADWVSYKETKATRAEKLIFSYAPLQEGTVTRTAEITFSNKLNGTLKTIELRQGNAVSLDRDHTTMVLDDELQLNATLKLPGQDLVWTSSDSDVAWVNQDGKIVAIACGTATISVMTGDYEHSASCVVNVIDITKDISLNYTSASDVSYNNGYVYPGTKLGWKFQNNSSVDVTIKYLQLIDYAGNAGNRMTVDNNLVKSGSYFHFTITIVSSIKGPKCKFVYEYNNREYAIVCSHMFKPE